MLVATRTRAKWYRTSRMSGCARPVSDSPMARNRGCMRPAIDKINMLPDQRCCKLAESFRSEVEFAKIIAG